VSENKGDRLQAKDARKNKKGAREKITLENSSTKFSNRFQKLTESAQRFCLDSAHASRCSKILECGQSISINILSTRSCTYDSEHLGARSIRGTLSASAAPVHLGVQKRPLMPRCTALWLTRVRLERTGALLLLL
jgi:hypothetical protein